MHFTVLFISTFLLSATCLAPPLDEEIIAGIEITLTNPELIEAYNRYELSNGDERLLSKYLEKRDKLNGKLQSTVRRNQNDHDQILNITAETSSYNNIFSITYRGEERKLYFDVDTAVIEAKGLKWPISKYRKFKSVLQHDIFEIISCCLKWSRIRHSYERDS